MGRGDPHRPPVAARLHRADAFVRRSAKVSAKAYSCPCSGQLPPFSALSVSQGRAPASCRSFRCTEIPFRGLRPLRRALRRGGCALRDNRRRRSRHCRCGSSLAPARSGRACNGLRGKAGACDRRRRGSRGRSAGGFRSGSGVVEANCRTGQSIATGSCGRKNSFVRLRRTGLSAFPAARPLRHLRACVSKARRRRSVPWFFAQSRPAYGSILHLPPSCAALAAATQSDCHPRRLPLVRSGLFVMPSFRLHRRYDHAHFRHQLQRGAARPADRF